MAKYLIYTKIVFVISLLCFSGVAHPNTTLSKDRAIELFTRANGEYETAIKLLSEKNDSEALESFARATRLYEKILDSGFKSGQIYYNLGNTYYRQGILGYAILNYRRSQKMMPRNEDLKTNLKLVKGEIKDREKKKEVPRVIQALLFWYYMLNVNEATVLAISFYVILIAVIHVLIFFRASWLKKLCIAFAVCLVLTTASLIIKIYHNRGVEGVVIAESCNLHYGPGEEYETKLEVHEGTELIIEQESKGWLKAYIYVDVAQLTDTKESEGFKTGWIPADTVGRIQ